MMSSYSIIKLVSFAVHTILGLYVVLKSPRRRLNQVFSLFVFSVAIMEFSHFMVLVNAHSVAYLFWMRIALLGRCLASVNVVLLSLIYGRENYRDLLKTGRLYLAAVYSIALAFIVIIATGKLNFTLWEQYPGYVLTFNRIGSFFIAFLLLCILIALLNLENTYRQARGSRKRMQYPAIVFIGLLSYQILVYSLALGLAYMRMDVLTASSIAYIIANICIAYPVIKPEPSGVGIYIGRAVIGRSYTILLAGIYLLLVGMLGKIVQMIGKNLNFFLAFLIAFFIILILMAAIVSRSLKQRFQSFIERNFYKSRYDYRKEWENFSRRVFSILSMKELLQEVLNTVSETMSVDNISIMLLDERKDKFVEWRLEGQDEKAIPSNDEFMDWLWRYGKPIKVDNGRCKAERTFRDIPEIPDNLLSMMDVTGVQALEKLEQRAPEASAHSANSSSVVQSIDHSPSGVIVPVIAENRLIAVMTLGQGKTTMYSQEDLDLLETMANQISIAIMNARTSQELAISRELESFYKLSAMLLHDLKSSASMLSLVVQNAADNFDNPEFQKDVLNTIGSVVNRIQKLILKLSTTPREVESQQFQPADLVEVINSAVAKSGMRDLAKIKVVEELNPVPRVMLDPESMERVILNLLSNAVEAIVGNGKREGASRGEEGVITIKTSQTPNGYVQISISDTGCGMSQEFIRDRLFQPFQTNKERGLGIGLYQCKTIIDACGGFIDVQSRVGSGSTFTIKLPKVI